MSRVNRDLDHILNINVVVAAAVTIHKAHFVATAVLATVGPVWAFILRRRGAPLFVDFYISATLSYRVQGSQKLDEPSSWTPPSYYKIKE